MKKYYPLRYHFLWYFRLQPADQGICGIRNSHFIGKDFIG